MEGGGRQRKRTRHSEDAPAAASSSSAGGGVESDEERQRREERERNLRQQITDTEGLLSYMMAFLPVNLMVQLAKSIWQHAAPDLSDVTISSATREERSFWQHVHLAFVTQLAARLTRLTTITLRYPDGFRLWCFDVFVAIIEGHTAGRRAANLTGGTLHIIAVKRGVRLIGTARQTVARTHPSLPAPLDPPPTLHALTTIAGLRDDHEELAERGWLVPSLAVVRQEGWDADRLSQLISSSRSLWCVDGTFVGEEWADVFEDIPATPAGQQGGPLAQLEEIGTILVEGDDLAGLNRLQEALVARGCRRSLKQLHVEFGAARIDRHTLPSLLALDRLVGTCWRLDAELILEVTTTSRFDFDLSMFYDTDFPTRPSPSLKTMLQQLARQAQWVKYILSQQDLIDNLGSPSQSAIDIVSSLSFRQAYAVAAGYAPGFDPPANTPSPHPAIITHMQPLPKFSEVLTFLCVQSKLRGAAARLFATKMPRKIERVVIGYLSSGEEKVGVLTALGSEREVGTVEMRQVDVDQLVGAADGLPTIRELEFTLTLPNGVEDAGSFVRTRLSSVISHIRGLRRVRLEVAATTADQRASVETSVAFAMPEAGYCVWWVIHSGGAVGPS
ncbi:unnamed protein product [Vitrella brassicaformis CCMP3155]|uniref:Uncharacterized protein n=1 Tax=Vitrella brassicaformis (strain CCMP3155) TaxID=1169540 RepID=A0A0G4FBM7_VITBC|nr:unnamed protein product [Vitrella brassicaformis CCMP3155]|eukprot:CEM10280.1 unnamed protein product [Vitrella brassicaformis CCMP3155]